MSNLLLVKSRASFLKASMRCICREWRIRTYQLAFPNFNCECLWFAVNFLSRKLLSANRCATITPIPVTKGRSLTPHFILRLFNLTYEIQNSSTICGGQPSRKALPKEPTVFKTVLAIPASLPTSFYFPTFNSTFWNVFIQLCFQYLFIYPIFHYSTCTILTIFFTTLRFR